MARQLRGPSTSVNLAHLIEKALAKTLRGWPDLRALVVAPSMASPAPIAAVEACIARLDPAWADFDGRVAVDAARAVADGAWFHRWSPPEAASELVRRITEHIVIRECIPIANREPRPILENFGSMADHDAYIRSSVAAVDYCRLGKSVVSSDCPGRIRAPGRARRRTADLLHEPL